MQYFAEKLGVHQYLLPYGELQIHLRDMTQQEQPNNPDVTEEQTPGIEFSL